MALLDTAFNVEHLSIDDKVLFISGDVDPNSQSIGAPLGSIYLSTIGDVYVKRTPLTNGWIPISYYGLPAGGATGDVLMKNSSTDYDASFVPATADLFPNAQRLLARVKNGTLATIPKGYPVYQTGIAGDGFTILVAPADASDPLKMPALGVLYQELAPEQEGDLVVLGEIHNMDTSAFNEGDLVYIAPGGGFTNVKPTDPNIALQFLGIVTKIHATNGGGFVTGTGTLDLLRNDLGSTFSGWTGTTWVNIGTTNLDSLTDVAITSPQLGEVLKYDGTSWINGSADISMSHTTLTDRSLADQHPISAITGLQTALDSKQNLLVSGTNIKTINGSSLLGAGDLVIYGGSSNQAEVDAIEASIGTVVNADGTYNITALASTVNINTSPSITQALIDLDSAIEGYSTLGGLSDVTITNPLVGETLFYNGAEWINYGAIGGTQGGGAAKRIWSSNISTLSGTTTIVPGIDPPLVTAGTQVWTITLSPLTAESRLVVQTSIAAATATNNDLLTLALFRNGVYIGGTLQITNSANNSSTLSFSITDSPNATSPVTYQARIGISTAGRTWYINRRTSEITYGGFNTGWVIWEY